MPGIMPDPASGGVIVRDSGGTCLSPSGVSNAYCPDPEFQTSCDLRYLPNDCTARITPAQINGFQSELMCFAETLNPGGSWNCGGLCNLSSAFTTWMTSTAATGDTLLNRVQALLCARPFRTQAQVDALPNSAFILCDGNGRLIRHNPPPPTVVAAGTNVLVEHEVLANGAHQYTVTAPREAADSIATRICADDDASGTLAECMVSTRADNRLDINAADGLLYVAPAGAANTVTAGAGIDINTSANPNGSVNYQIVAELPNADAIVNAICADDTAHDNLADCLISGIAGNALVQASDGGLYTAANQTPQQVATSICGNTPARSTLAACLISTQAGNDLVQGSDDRLYINTGPGSNTLVAGPRIAITTAPNPDGSIAYTVASFSNTVVAGPGITVTNTTGANNTLVYTISQNGTRLRNIVDGDNIDVVATANADGTTDYAINFTGCAASIATNPNPGDFVLTCRGGVLRRMDVDTFNPTLVEIANRRIDNGYPAVINIGAAAITSADVTVITNPHPIPIRVQLQATAHMRLEVSGNNQAQANWDLLVDGVAVSAGHSIASGPDFIVGVADSFNTRTTFVTIPAGGSTTVSTRVSSAYIASNNPNPARDNVQGAQFEISWQGNGLIPINL